MLYQFRVLIVTKNFTNGSLVAVGRLGLTKTNRPRTTKQTKLKRSPSHQPPPPRTQAINSLASSHIFLLITNYLLVYEVTVFVATRMFQWPWFLKQRQVLDSVQVENKCKQSENQSQGEQLHATQLFERIRTDQQPLTTRLRWLLRTQGERGKLCWDDG